MVGFNDQTLYLLPFNEPHGIGPGAKVTVLSHTAQVKLGPQLLGRIIDGSGEPLDGLPPPACEDVLSLQGRPINPMERGPINQILDVGVKAINGMLTVMCGGASGAFERAKPVAMAFAKAFTLMGESGAGQLTKMVNQICIAGLVQGLSEGIAFGMKAGLNMTQVLEVIGKGAAQSWQMDNRGKTMVEDKFDFGFAVDWMRKDLGLVMDEAKRNGARVPVTALVDQFYADVQAMGGNRLDTSSLIKRLR